MFSGFGGVGLLLFSMVCNLCTCCLDFVMFLQYAPMVEGVKS